jgi:mono/diheme cytochrome c family protein
MGSRTHAGRRGVLLLVVLGLVARPATSGDQRATGVEVTPVRGPSTLHHLGLTIERSSMGWGGQWSPPPSLVRSPHSQADNTARHAFVLSGADLYRISCRACHRPDGSGSPPEVNSLIGPVQAASFQWMTQRMKAMGRPVDPAFIRQLTSGTEADLRKRLKVGGHNMPSFDHLSDAEITVLRPYLNEMAGVPGAQRRHPVITEPSARVGELIVKGTCHICHDATGPSNMPPTTVLNDIIPALASMPHQKTFYQFVQKVREGAPIPLSAGGVLSRGRMPVFDYLTESEVASAYSYLSIYPPK